MLPMGNDTHIHVYAKLKGNFCQHFEGLPNQDLVIGSTVHIWIRWLSENLTSSSSSSSRQVHATNDMYWTYIFDTMCCMLCQCSITSNFVQVATSWCLLTELGHLHLLKELKCAEVHHAELGREYTKYFILSVTNDVWKACVRAKGTWYFWSWPLSELRVTGIR